MASAIALQASPPGVRSISYPNATTPLPLTFTGLASNTDYTLWLLAEDVSANCQARVTSLAVRTDDNTPPVTVAADITAVTGTTATAALALDEPGVMYYMVMEARDAAPSCPAAGVVSRTLSTRSAAVLQRWQLTPSVLIFGKA